MTDDPLTRMFAWWNQAYREPEGFAEAALATFFAPDAEMWINGERRACGLDGLSERFRTVQAGTEEVMVELPFLDSFASADGRRIYTRHRVRFTVAGKAGGELVGGWAALDDAGRIARIDFLSIEQS